MSGIRPPSSASGRATPTGGRSTPVQGFGGKRDSLSTPMGSSTSGGSGSGLRVEGGLGSSTSGGTAPGSGGSTSVQVALRIRPVTAQDSIAIPQRFQRSVVSCTSATSLSIENPTAPSAGGKQSKQTFNFDRVISPQEGQSGVYKVAEGLVDKFLEGYNVTILAYGQTGSGKSYTMGTDYSGGELAAAEEDLERWGVIPRAVNSIFERIRQLGGPTRRFELKNSYIEIYNEDLIDLLNERGREAPHGSVTIREEKGQIIWSGLRELGVRDVEEVMLNLSQGSSLRQTNSTDMNAQSSRSHAIFSLTLVQRKYTGSNPHPPSPNPTNKRASFQGARSLQSPTSGRATPSGIPERPGSRFGLRASTGGAGGRPVSPGPNMLGDAEEEVGEWTTITSKFHFVDLAGSERLKRTSAVGERAKEGISINSGLHALGNVISALGDPVKARQTTHIPYRDSKLTRLLQDSLGGNAHTLMIACASGSEYNLAETLNTLKYANRARNIKNRAEVNEVEVGWEDVEYLQKVVLKLREELASIRNGGGSGLRTINEEGIFGHVGSGGGGADSGAMLELQEQYSELSQKYAKMTAELTKAQAAAHSNLGGGASGAIGHHLTPEAFEQAVAPVVQEYEKSLSALESQLALTKAALVHAEDSMKDQEEKLLFEQQVNETNANLIDELKSRVAKLAEREALAEGYVRDLESKLKAEADRQDVDADLVGELRKEIQKYKEVENNNERYIKDLENRLSKAEEGALILQNQVEDLEREVERREGLYKELEGRMLLLDTSDQHKMILEELEEKERRLVELERNLEDLKEEKDGFEQERERLNQIAERTMNDKIELQLQLRNLQEEKNAALEKLQQQQQKQLTPPHTPDMNQQPSDSELDLEYKLERLQIQHQKALYELQTINQKYKDSLKEIEDLAQQVEEARLISSESQDILPSPLPSPALHHSTSFPSLRNATWEKDLDVPPVPPLPHSARDQSFGNKSPHAPKSPRSRRSMPLAAGPRLSFLAQPRNGSSNAHLRSVSLSQELSSAQGSLSAYPHSPRAVSPNGAIPVQNERSYESLEKEVMQLQETLKSREEEINHLERSIRELEKLEKSSPPQPSRSESQTINPQDEKTPTAIDSTTPPTVNGASTPEESPYMSPQTLSAFTALKEELAELNGPTEFTEEELQARLDKLMRSMARKESAHRQIVDELQDQLTGLTRQHEDLKALSHNQVINMSTEIESLRSQIRIGEQNEALREKLTTLEEALRKAAQETENIRLEAENQVKEACRKLISEHRALLDQNAEDHAAAIRSLKEEHAQDMRKALDERDQLMASKTAELEAALQSRMKDHEDALRKKDGEHVAALEAKNNQHIASLRQRDEEHTLALQRFEQTFSERNSDDVNAALQSAKVEHNAALAKREADYEVALTNLKSEHTALLSSKESDHTAAISRLTEEQENVITRMIESHAEAINRLREERDSDLKRMRDSHGEEVATLKAQHEKKLDEVNLDIENRLADLTATHERRISDLGSEHEATLNLIRSQNESVASERTTTLAVEFEEKIRSVEAKHLSDLQSLSAKHDQAMDDLRVSHQTTLQQLEVQHSEAVAALELSHRNAFQQQIATHEQQLIEARSVKGESEAAINALKEEHATAVSSLTAGHVTAIAKLSEDHESIVRQLKLEHAQILSTQQDAQNAILEQARSQLDIKTREQLSHSEAFDAQRAQLADDITRLQADLRASEMSKDQIAAKVQVLMDQMRRDAEQHDSERSKLEQSLAEARESLQASRVSIDQHSVAESELQDALDALSTLEKALKESQDEKERLMSQLDNLRLQAANQIPSSKYDTIVKDLERHRSSLSQLQVELDALRLEKDALTADKIRQDQYIKELQQQVANLAVDGSHSNGYHGRTDSLTSNDAIGFDSRSPRMSPTLHAGSLTVSANGTNGSIKAPPPTPPPTMPPPPLPSSSNHTNSVSISSTSSRPRNSSTSSVTRNSDSPPTTTRSPTNSMTDSITIDARVARKLEEQEILITKLTKQLHHCESDLQANVDLVNTLESALNDSERNLRKARMQMNDLSKERDEFSRQNDQLRQQVLESRQEVDNLRSREQAVESRLEQERLAKESARNQLDRRMEEMSRRKSKFNCF
ncbi:kinesin-domain-containing protein [Atractiella rhizophila]|nr:kinesin-domain-containing protein [Atractiella rhizophila]